MASSHLRASQVGAEILKQGGNAIDAAVATSFALGVLEPWMSGVGGGGYMVYRRAATGEVKVVDFGMRSPAGLNPADYPLDGGVASDLFPWLRVADDMNALGAKSIAVPGVVAGMSTALRAFGTLSWSSLVKPAVKLAETGLPIDWYTQLMISSVCRELGKFPKTREIFLESDGLPKSIAWTAMNSTRCDLSLLAQTLDDLAENGPEYFYTGELGNSIVADIRAAGGSITSHDLATYSARIVDPLEIPYGAGVVHATPELTAGPTLADALAAFPKAGPEGLKPDSYVAFAEALLEAYRIRLETMGDGNRGDTGCTTHFNVVDKDGNLAAVTQTLLSVFGSKVVLPGSGILMNNGIMWFDPEPGKPNSLAPNRRCLSNMCPVIVTTSEAVFAIGAAGGRKILPAVAQLAAFLVDYGLELETAFHTPRIDVSGTESVIANENLSPEVLEALDCRFHVIKAPYVTYPNSFGVPSAVLRTHENNRGMTEVMSPWADVVAEFDG